MKLPQFSLRDLFWLVLVFAVALGWIVSQTIEEGSFIVALAFLLGASGFWFVVGFIAGVTIRDKT